MEAFSGTRVRRKNGGAVVRRFRRALDAFCVLVQGGQPGDAVLPPWTYACLVLSGLETSRISGRLTATMQPIMTNPAENPV